MTAQSSSAPTIEDLLGRGYFPKELPPTFVTVSFGKFCQSLGSTGINFDTNDPRASSKPELFHLARAGNLRRELAILNPIHYALVCECVVKNWADIALACESTFSLTKPTVSSSGRALERAVAIDALPERRAEARKIGRYLLKTDISRFYQSVYTHSIPWAFHSKAVAKRNYSRSLFGNHLDALVRNCQDKQTIGIPVGPDVSLAIAEALLAQVDKVLKHEGLGGFRYIDDYEMVFLTEQEALQARSKLQALLLDYELHLNPQKTSINSLPQPMQEPWVAELSTVEIRASRPDYRRALIRYCDIAFKLAKEHPNDGVLKYAAGTLAKLPYSDLVANLLSQFAATEPGCLGIALRPLLKRTGQGSKKEIEEETKLLVHIVQEHAPQRHSSEVAWAIWAALVLKRSLPTELAELVFGMGESVCALLLLHARELKLIEDGAAFRKLRADLLSESLYGPRWLLLYQSLRSGWIRVGKAKNPVLADVNFKRLWDGGISFYDKGRIELPEGSQNIGRFRLPSSRDEVVEKYLAGFRADYGSRADDDEEEGGFKPYPPRVGSGSRLTSPPPPPPPPPPRIS